jgi:hypothetical protein
MSTVNDDSDSYGGGGTERYRTAPYLTFVPTAFSLYPD